MIDATPSQKVDTISARVKYPPAGKYVVAVSGGVDSVALLDLLAKKRELGLVVAHFDHGWREDSHLDAELVKSLGKILNIEVIAGRAFGQLKSEAAARQQRYDFLNNVAAMQGAVGLVTAHHADDQIETSILNLFRGTSRRGRAPKFHRPGIFRPLEGIGKTELMEYAQANGLPWREDSTNLDLGIPRNFIRHELLPFARGNLPQFHRVYAEYLASINALSDQIEQHLDAVSFDRRLLRRCSLPLIAESLASAVRKIEPGLQLTRKQLNELAHSIKTGRTGIRRDIAGRLSLEVARDKVSVALPRGQI